ncbi:DUF4386 domain-containing protein [Cyclobacterium sp.]|uniref:DUF4386 domain-containing protein n=1 Tax=Cyclobacterium sp. TaxID=1966343 RepID=UPI0019B6104F|nr:DUF4386 domain-containing protein [Cyclobacterium sp.]MBD3627998.1 DUF4386 domain-containing protein [Cyclobacterium sp.]
MNPLHELLERKAYMRQTGLMYLLVIVLAGFSQGYIRSSLIVPDDAVATSLNISGEEDLFRLGLGLDLIAFLLDAIISILLFKLFRAYGQTVALTVMVLRLLAHPAIGSLNLLNHYLALQTALAPDFLAGFDGPQLQSMSLLFMEAHRIGYLIAGVFFGLHCLLLGLLLYRSPVPGWLGILMIMAGIGYEMEAFGDFLFPGNEAWLAVLVGVTAVLGEVTLTAYLLIKGFLISKLNANDVK